MIDKTNASHIFSNLPFIFADGLLGGFQNYCQTMLIMGGAGLLLIPFLKPDRMQAYSAIVQKLGALMQTTLMS